MTRILPEGAPLQPGEQRVSLCGRTVRLVSDAEPGELERSVQLLEQTFRDMEEAYELRWGNPPGVQDTHTWMLLGALNLAHRLMRLEQEASQQTQNLEQTLTKLLDDVPDDPDASGGPPEG